MQDYNPNKEQVLEKFLSKNFGNEIFRGELERTRRFFFPFKKKFKKILTVAGTNGKGETSTHLANLIQSNGSRTALWTSPHILSIRERFSFEGKIIDYDELFEEFKNSHEIIKLFFGKFSYYEFLFFVFIRLARRKKIEVLVLEVGLGGRLDAVNHFDAQIALISSISRDHQAILGNTLEKILFEKLGITRPSCPLITALELEYCRFMAKNFCKEKDIPFYDLHHLGIVDESMDYSTRNKYLAAYAFEYFKNPGPPGRINIQKYSFQKLKGRFEEIKFGPITFIFVGSHNIDGVRKLVQKISLGKQEFDAVLISFSKRDPKEIETILGIFSNAFKKVQVTTFEHIKAASNLNEYAQKFNAEFVADWKRYLEDKIKNPGKEEILLVSGSYYFVGEIQKFLLSSTFNTTFLLRPAEVSTIPG